MSGEPLIVLSLTVVVALAEALKILVGRLVGSRATDRPQTTLIAEQLAAVAHSMKDVTEGLRLTNEMQVMVLNMLEKRGQGTGHEGKVRHPSGAYPTLPSKDR